jgi:3-oxoacyl-[acyl-carrier-protein] synthase-3
MNDAATTAGGTPVRSLMGVQIVATGSFLPERVVTNQDLGALGCDPEWIEQRTGIRERRHALPGVRTSDLATEAARRCLRGSGVDPAEIDLLVLATCTPDRLMPATATSVQHQLGLACPAFDLSAVCAGFTYALATAMQFVATGSSRCALVIGADVLSRITDPRDKKTYPLFGDGAGAVLLAPGSAEQGALAFSWGADGANADLLCRPASAAGFSAPDESGAPEGWYLRMDGRAVFKWAVRLVEDNSLQVLRAAGLEPSQIDWWVLHQANLRILDAAAEALGIDRQRMALHIDRYGNTSAASVPIALDELVRSGCVRRGQRLVLAGFGAGLAWGTLAWRW